MRLADILERGSYLLVDRDTTLAASARVDRDIIVVRSRLSLGGVVEGSIAVVSGEVFVRPGAQVTGELIEVGGAVYPSARAEAGPVVRLDPDLDVDVEPD